jgi:SH3-like domain-containing protein
MTVTSYESVAVAAPTETPTSTFTPIPSATITLSPLPPTLTPSSTPTLTATPTLTPTLDPEPTPAWASVKPNEFGGAFVRAEPDYAATVVKSLLNDFVVEILPESEQQGSTIWVKVRTQDGTIGWMVRSLLITATPVP